MYEKHKFNIIFFFSTTYFSYITCSGDKLKFTFNAARKTYVALLPV